MVKVYSGEYAVFASGMLYSFSKQDDFELLIAPSDSFKFTIFFSVIDNDGERDFTKDVKEDKIYFKCYNFGTGAGTTQPVEIATFSNKKMYIHFWIERIDASQKVLSLTYTIYIER